MDSHDDMLRLEIAEHRRACDAAWAPFQECRGLDKDSPQTGFICGARRLGSGWLVFVIGPPYFGKEATAALVRVDLMSGDALVGFNSEFDWSAAQPPPHPQAFRAAAGNWERIVAEANAEPPRLRNQGKTFGEIMKNAIETDEQDEDRGGRDQEHHDL